jgi:hypothetical protein
MNEQGEKKGRKKKHTRGEKLQHEGNLQQEEIFAHCGIIAWVLSKRVAE